MRNGVDAVGAVGPDAGCNESVAGEHSIIPVAVHDGTVPFIFLGKAQWPPYVYVAIVGIKNAI